MYTKMMLCIFSMLVVNDVVLFERGADKQVDSDVKEETDCFQKCL